MRGWSLLGLLLLLAGCDRASTPLYLPDGEDYPATLSAWGLLERDGGRLQPVAAAVPYDLNTPLFTDYAHKLRTLWMPPGSHARYAQDHFDYPLGTVLSKTFYYPRDAQGHLRRTRAGDPDMARSLVLDKVQLIETRLLLKQRQGWVALPYVWDADQREARLEWAGASQSLSLLDEQGQTLAVDYQVPDANQCAGCHEERHGQGINPLGPKARHLNKLFDYAEGPQNQLTEWQRRGVLDALPADLTTVPQNAQWGQPRTGETLEHQARSYLDANCAHCHNPQGPARTSGLLLDPGTPLSIAFGLCKPPVAAGKGSGDRLVDIHPGQPERSVLSYRVQSVDPSVMMPELGRSTVHREGVEVLNRWIAQLPGGC
ncbi:MAG: SO2930 family diheme c-type cytochrome [Pseudomonas sp.]|uniref:SO2930 family diheme c-type cytochrome n=1 Tax=Pseudomonas sp. TaxID=306 RepID=UPI00339B109A